MESVSMMDNDRKGMIESTTVVNDHKLNYNKVYDNPK